MITDQLILYIGLIATIIIVGFVFRKSSIPFSMLLVMVGMLLSFIPNFPRIHINSEIVLNIFLPLLLYQAGAFASWRDIKLHMRAIALLSIGHVIFITILVATAIHLLIPTFSWPLAFVLGAVISPPDDVAFLSVIKKIHLPQRIITVLTGEALLNDATALTLFRFSLLAVASHQFSALNATSTFILIIVGETLYGLALGYIAGQIRMHIKDTTLQIMLSMITPFLAFLVPEKLGGSGVISTVVTGIVIGTRYLPKFEPEVRLAGESIWNMIAFTIQNILFLLVGLELRYIVERISSIPFQNIVIYSVTIVMTVIVGRFIWVFLGTYLPRLLYPSLQKNDPAPSWQSLFIISWAGMRGGISLAAALAVPLLPATVDGANLTDLLLFLVFCVIVATLLLQGLSLPWLIKKLGMHKYGQSEKYQEHLAELSARQEIKKTVLNWLVTYEKTIHENVLLHEEVKLRIKEYKTLQRHLKTRIDHHNDEIVHDQAAEIKSILFLSMKLIALERKEIERLWIKNRITYAVKRTLTLQLDHREKHLTAYT